MSNVLSQSSSSLLDRKGPQQYLLFQIHILIVGKVTVWEKTASQSVFWSFSSGSTGDATRSASESTKTGCGPENTEGSVLRRWNLHGRIEEFGVVEVGDEFEDVVRSGPAHDDVVGR